MGILGSSACDYVDGSLTRGLLLVSEIHQGYLLDK